MEVFTSEPLPEEKAQSALVSHSPDLQHALVCLGYGYGYTYGHGYGHALVSHSPGLRHMLGVASRRTQTRCPMGVGVSPLEARCWVG